MRVAEKLRAYLCPPSGRTLRTVIIVGPPESGKTTAAASLAEMIISYYAGLGKPGCVRFLDVDERIPAEMRLETLEDVVDAIETCESPVLVVCITDPGMALSYLFTHRRRLSAFIDTVWRARHVNPHVDHMVLILGTQTLGGVTKKLRSLGTVLVIKAAGPEEWENIGKLLGKAGRGLRGVVARITEEVYLRGRKDLAAVVFPTLPWHVVSFRYPSTLLPLTRKPEKKAAQRNTYTTIKMRREQCSLRGDGDAEQAVQGKPAGFPRKEGEEPVPDDEPGGSGEKDQGEIWVA